jgi:probable phosphoglycerate mutase
MFVPLGASPAARSTGGERVRRIYVVTHPDAEHHLSGQVGGWFDSALTERGLRQADAIAARIAVLVPAGSAVEIYSSDLTRTVQTAQAIGGRLGVQPELLAVLEEDDFFANRSVMRLDETTHLG